MRSAGVDVASAGFAAIGLAIDGKPSIGMLWKAEKNDADPVKLEAWANFLTFKFAILKPNVISVEELAVFMNKRVIRSLSKMEGVALLQAKKYKKALVVNPPVTQARAIVFKDQGVRSKEDAWQAFKKQYPDFKLPAATSGGMDIADALVHAIAGPVILERRK